MRDQDLTSGAKKIAKALKSPGGQIAFARVVARHLDWFDLAQERGLAWDQMIAVLHAAGAARPDGQPLTRGHVSSAVWRARKSATSNPASSIKETHKKSGNVAGATEAGRPSPSRLDAPVRSKKNTGKTDSGELSRKSQAGDDVRRATLGAMRKAAALRRGPGATD